MADKKLFRKKPVVIEAIQWDGTLAGIDDIISVFPDIRTVAKTAHPPTNKCSFWKIGTLEGSHEVSAGDFIIRGVKGEYYPCKPDIFFMTYEPATATPPADAARILADTVEQTDANLRAATDGRLGVRECPPADAALADVVERVAVIWAPGTVRHRELMQAAAALRARAVPERFVDAANRAKNITADVLRTHPETYVAHIHGLADLILTLASRQSQETSVPKVLNDVLEIHGSNPRDDLSHDLAQDAARTAMLAMTAAITAMRNANYFVRDQIEAARRQESE